MRRGNPTAAPPCTSITAWGADLDLALKRRATFPASSSPLSTVQSKRLLRCQIRLSLADAQLGCPL